MDDARETITEWLLKKLAEADDRDDRDGLEVDSYARIDGETTVGLEVDGQTYFLSVQRS